jgi:hypothetical protein
MSTPNVESQVKNHEWNKTMTSATDAAGAISEMTGHAAGAVGEVVAGAATAIGEGADRLTASTGQRIQALGSAMGDCGPKSGLLGDASQAMAETVKRGGRYLERAKMTQTTSAVTELIRQHPIASMLTGVAAGFLLCRALKD